MAEKALLDPRVLGGCVFYSQNREDLVLLAFFAGEKDGFYVDVGAFDPDEDSVTKLFYLAGWRGINVEPQLERHKRFQKARPRDINLNIGIAAEESQLTLRSYASQGLSTFSETVKRSYEKAPDQDTGQYAEATVPVRPLRHVFAEHDVKRISFLKVDVEGLEYEVLISNDWETYRPEVLCIESNHIINDWHPLLQKVGYELVFQDGLNEYFVDSRTDRKAKFDYVKEVVHDRGGGIRAEHYDLLLEWWRFGCDKAHHVEELLQQVARLEGQVGKQKDRIKALEVENISIRQTSKRLAGLIKRNIKKSIRS